MDLFDEFNLVLLPPKMAPNARKSVQSFTLKLDLKYNQMDLMIQLDIDLSVEFNLVLLPLKMAPNASKSVQSSPQNWL